MTIKRIDPFWSTLLLSGACGFFVGMLRYPSWHQAVEGAQIAAQAVHYPVQTPFFLYHSKVWTLLHQFLGLFLQLGFSETDLSLFVSGLAGMLSYQALSGLFYAFSGGKLRLSVLFPFLVDYLRISSLGPVYPILLHGHSATYGMVGFSYMLLTVVFLSLKKYRAGCFLMGLAPAIHAPLGMTTLFIVIFTCLFLKAKTFKKGIRAFTLGMLVSLLSYAVHQKLFPPFLSGVSFSPAELSIFIRNWDSHRIPVSLLHPGVGIGILSFIMSGILVLKSRKLSQEMGFLAVFLFFSGGLGILAVLTSWVPFEKVPAVFLAMMPARVINFPLAAFPALAAGLFLYFPHRFFHFMALGMVAVLILSKRFYDQSLPAVLIFFGISAIFFVLFESRLHTHSETLPSRSSGLRPESWAILGILSLLALKMLFQTALEAPRYGENFHDWTNRSFLNEIKERNGILLASPDFPYAQLRTRRPVFFDFETLDAISYFPEMGPPMREAIQAVYGLDVLADREEGPASGRDRIQEFWESRSTGEWQVIAVKYGIRDVMTSAGYALKLPKIREDGEYCLFEIPFSEPSAPKAVSL